MRKTIASFIAFSLFIITAACSSNNTAKQNIGNNLNNGNVGNITSANTPYKDGTYNGMGDKRATGTETAAVTIKAGKITNVTLGTIDKSGNRISYNNGSGAGNNVSGMDDALGGSNRNIGYNTGHNTTGNSSQNTKVSDNSNRNNNTLTTTPSVTLDQLRVDLSNAIVQYQTPNITVNTNSEYDIVVKNWQLAVRRALDQSSK